MPLVDLARTDKELKEREKAFEEGDVSDRNRYPWGLSITLDELSLVKLGVTDMPKVGESIDIQASAEITEASMRSTPGGDDRRLELTVKKLDLGMINDDSAASDAAKKLFGSSSAENSE